MGDRGADGERTAQAARTARTAGQGVPPASIVTPANQKIYKPQSGNNPRNQAKNSKGVEKERQTDSSINTLPMLPLKEAVDGAGGVGGADGVREAPRSDSGRGALNVPSAAGASNAAGATNAANAANAPKSGGQARAAEKKQMASSSQLAGNEVSVSNTQEIMGATSPIARGARLKDDSGQLQKQRAGSDDVRRQAAGAQQGKRRVDPLSASKDIATARVRLEGASHRRKSLEPPIDSEDANRLDGLRNDLESRKRPQTGRGGLTVVQRRHRDEATDGIRNAKLYLGSDGGGSTGASIGSAAGNSDVLHAVEKSRRRAENPGDDFFDVSKLPAHLKRSLDMIKKRKLEASVAKKKKAIDLTGLQRMKEEAYDPRRLMN